MDERVGRMSRPVVDQEARILDLIRACETGNSGEGPLWLALLGWADWQMELTLLQAGCKDARRNEFESAVNR